MNLRKPATFLLLATLLLGACNFGSSTQQPTPSPTTATAIDTVAPITTPPQATLPTEATTAPPTTGAAATPAPQQTPSSVDKQQLALSPVQIETTDATRKGALSTGRTINLPRAST